MLRDDVLRRPRALRLHGGAPSSSSPTSTCSSATCARAPRKFEGEIIAMTLDLLHGADGRTAATPSGWSPPAAPAASCTRCSPTASTRARSAASTRPNIIKPETAHPAFDKACHLFGVELRRAPVDPETTHGRGPRPWPTSSTSNTIAHHRLGVQLRLRHDRPDRRALGPRARARRRPARRRLPRRLHPAVGRGARVRHPAVRLPRTRRHVSISADTHKYGYGLKGTSVLAVPRHGRCATASTSS